MIYSTSPNVTNHLVAARTWPPLERPWVADFRDPWTNGPVYQFGRWRHPIDRTIEQENPAAKRHESSRSPKAGKSNWSRRIRPPRTRSQSSRTGSTTRTSPSSRRRHETIASPSAIVASSTEASRNPDGLFSSADALEVARPYSSGNFTFTIIGRKEPEIVAQITKYGISDLVELTDYLPHRQALKRMAQAAVGLVITMTLECSRGEMTTKFYECLGLRRPILGSPRNTSKWRASSTV